VFKVCQCQALLSNSHMPFFKWRTGYVGSRRKSYELPSYFILFKAMKFWSLLTMTPYPIYQRSFLFILQIFLRTSKFLTQNSDLICFLVACRTHFVLKLCSDYYYLPSSDEWFCRVSCMVDTTTAHCLFCGASRTALGPLLPYIQFVRRWREVGEVCSFLGGLATGIWS
jgi:hypothetical protein